MMRVFGLVLAMVVLLAGAVCAVEVQFDIAPGWNMVASPVVPLNSDPLTVFKDCPNGIDGLLSRWDPSIGGVGYDALDPASFGGVLLGDGFWLLSDSAATVKIDGVPDGVPDALGARTDMWISLPGSSTDGADAGGWHIIGYPYNKSMQVDSGVGTGDQVLFTDGTTVKIWGDAVAAGWVDSAFIGWNAGSGGMAIQPDGLGDSTSLDPGRGYWVHTYKDNLAMILLAQYSN